LTLALRGGAFRGATLGGCRFVVRDGEVLVLREPGRRGLDAFGLAPGETRLWDRRFEVASPASARAAVTVRALGAQGAREFRARAGAAIALPHAAAASLVSFWGDEGLLAVPSVGFDAG